MYRDDLPTPHHVSAELVRWKHKFANMADKPNSLAQALKVCVQTIFCQHLPSMKDGMYLASY